MPHINADSGSGATGVRNLRLSRIKSASQTIAANTRALPASELAACGAVKSSIRTVHTSTPSVARTIAPIKAGAGRSPSASIATTADTAGRVPAITPASAADASFMPLISNTV
jgi:hypothetical protein